MIIILFWNLLFVELMGIHVRVTQFTNLIQGGNHT